MKRAKSSGLLARSFSSLFVPDEIWMKIFKHLDLSQIGRCAQVLRWNYNYLGEITFCSLRLYSWSKNSYWFFIISSLLGVCWLSADLSRPRLLPRLPVGWIPLQAERLLVFSWNRPPLQRVELHQCDFVTNTVLQQMALNCTRLESLKLIECRGLTCTLFLDWEVWALLMMGGCR